MPRDDDLEAAIAALYQGARGEFLPARKALATRLRREGRTDEAAQVSALAKPTLSAWAVSRLFAREPRAMQRLLAEGEDARQTLRETLSRGGDPGALRDAIESVRRAGASLAQRAAELGREDAGKAPSATIVDRIAVDLSALALSPSAAEAASRGWIAADLDPPGLEILTELPPIARSASPRRASIARPRAAARAASVERPRAQRAAAVERPDAANERARARERAAKAAERERARADARAAKAAERERARVVRERARERERAQRVRLEQEARRAEERAAELRRAAERAAKLAEDAHRRAERARSAARARR